MKYAVYVEGQSEMLFVADVLQKYSDYDASKCGFICINLTADIYENVNYPKQGDLDSEDYYQIINVNNDNLVVSKLQKDCHQLAAKGFNVILGLKDVFGESYQRLMANRPIIDRDKIEHLHAIQTKVINSQGVDCRLHFAIMEYETWMLALIENYVTNADHDLEKLYAEFGIDPTHDFEQTIYHPFPLVQKIYRECGETYHKHGKESYSFLASLTVDDYERLRHSGRCASFTKFLDSLLDNRCPALP